MNVLIISVIDFTVLSATVVINYMLSSLKFFFERKRCPVADFFITFRNCTAPVLYRYVSTQRKGDYDRDSTKYRTAYLVKSLEFNFTNNVSMMS